MGTTTSAAEEVARDARCGENDLELHRRPSNSIGRISAKVQAALNTNRILSRASERASERARWATKSMPMVVIIDGETLSSYRRSTVHGCEVARARASAAERERIPQIA